MTESRSDFTATGVWKNLVEADAATGNVAVLIQNHDTSDVFVVFGGTVPTGNRTGVRLATYDSMQGESSAIWIRSGDGNARIVVTVL